MCVCVYEELVSRLLPRDPRSAFHHLPDSEQESPKSPSPLFAASAALNTLSVFCISWINPIFLGHLFGYKAFPVCDGDHGNCFYDCSLWKVKIRSNFGLHSCTNIENLSSLKLKPAQRFHGNCMKPTFHLGCWKQGILRAIVPISCCAAASQFSGWVTSSLVGGGWRWCNLFPTSNWDLFASVGSSFFQITPARQQSGNYEWDVLIDFKRIVGPVFFF